MLKKISLLFSDYWVNYLYFIYKQGYIPRFKKPRSFNEKLMYIKIFNRNPLRAKITDRLWVRGYVSEKSCDLKLIDVLWSGTDFTEEVWKVLPSKFVLKANHGSNMTKIIDKNNVAFDEVCFLSKVWMNNNYAQYGREWFYYDQKKYLIAERFLSFNGGVPPDYKFFCFQGRVELILIDIGRFDKHRRNLYSRSFERLPVQLLFPSGEDIDKPKNLDLAIKIAEELSIDFDFVRVDLYLLDDGVFFGELTNTPGAGASKFTPRAFDFDLGARLPDFIVR